MREIVGPEIKNIGPIYRGCCYYYTFIKCKRAKSAPRPSSRSGLGSGLAFPRPAGWLGLGPVSAGRGQAGGRARPNHRPWSPVARPGPASAPAWLSQAAGLRNPLGRFFCFSCSHPRGRRPPGPPPVFFRVSGLWVFLRAVRARTLR